MTIGTKRGDFTHIGKSTYVIDCQMEGIPRERQSRSEESPRLRCYEQSHKEREEINEDGTINQEISEENRGENIWFKLPTDVQNLIIQYLSVFDYMNFRAACKKWRSLVSPIKWEPNYSGTPLKHPWFMFSKGRRRYNLYDPIGNLMHCMIITELEDCEIHFSKNGWLLVTKAPTSIFFFEPFTRRKIQLPDLMENYKYDGFCFSDPPTSSNWHIFGIKHEVDTNTNTNTIEVLYLQSGADQIWRFKRFSREKLPRHSANTNPYCCGPNCCYLGNDGSLVVLQSREREFYVFVAARLRLSSDSVSASSRRYLFGVGKELMLVCLDDMGKMIDVFKCDFKGRKWVQIKSLEGKTLYLSRTTSLFLEEILDPKVKNTIQLSRFSNMHKDYGSNVSYCLESQRYQLYGNHAQALPDLSHTMEFHSGFWIQPLLLPQMIMNDV